MTERDNASDREKTEGDNEPRVHFYPDRHLSPYQGRYFKLYFSRRAVAFRRALMAYLPR